MKSFISRNKEKLLVFLLVSMLALPLAYMGCHGKGQIQTGAETEDLKLEVEPVVSIDDQLAELRAEFEAKLEELKNQDVPETDDSYVKTLQQLRELDDLKKQLLDLEKERDEKEKELADAKEEVEEKAVEVEGDAIKTFKMTLLAAKNRNFFRSFKDYMSAVMGRDKDEGADLSSNASMLKVGFCSKTRNAYKDDDEGDCKKFQVLSTAKIEDEEVVITEKDLEGFADAGLKLKDTRVIKLYDSGKSMHIGPVQIGINGKLAYITPSANIVIGGSTGRGWAAFNKLDDWAGIVTTYTRDHLWIRGVKCTRGDGESNMNIHIEIPPSQMARDDFNSRVTGKSFSRIYAPDGSNEYRWSLQGPGNAFKRKERGLFVFTAPFGAEPDFGNYPKIKYRLHDSPTDINRTWKGWCSGGKHLRLVRIQDLVKGEPEPGGTLGAQLWYVKVGDKTFGQDIAGPVGRQTGWHEMGRDPAAPITGMQGDGGNQEGLLAAPAMYSFVEVVEEGEEEVEGEEVVEESKYDALNNAVALLEEGLNAMMALPMMSGGYELDDTLIGTADAKLDEKIAEYNAVTVDASAEDQEAAAKAVEDKKACLKTEITKLEDAVHSMKMSAIKATIAQIKAQIAYLTAQIEVVEIESSDKAEEEATVAIVNALSGLETKVNEQIIIVKAEAAAARTAFDSVKAMSVVEGVCTEGEALLVAPADVPTSEEGSDVEPTEEELQEPEETEGQEEEAQEGEGEEEEATPSP